MTHIHDNQIKICINFACSWMEQEFLFESEGALSTHFAFFSSFLRWKKQVFGAEVNPPSTLAGSLFALPREVCISKGWDTTPGTVRYLPRDCIPLQRSWCKLPWTASGWEKKRHLLAQHHSSPSLVPTSQTCSFHLLCAGFFCQQNSFTYLHFIRCTPQTDTWGSSPSWVHPVRALTLDGFSRFFVTHIRDLRQLVTSVSTRHLSCSARK